MTIAEHAAEKSLDILAMGEAMVEFNQTGAEGGRAFLQGFGGDTSNAAIAAARQGARVGYLSALGADAHGALLRALWREEGVDQSAVATDDGAATGVYFVTHSENGHAFSFLRAGSAASRMRPGTIDHAAVARARLLHLSGVSFAISDSAADACYGAMETARASGTALSFDTNLRLKLWSLARARAIMSDVIARCDFCLPSYDDIVAISGKTEPDALVDWCLERGAKVVALKLGADGALVADGRQRVMIAPFPCRPVDATGAGDTFGGAFLARILAGDPLDAAGRYAAAAAALSTQGYGAVAPIPREEAVRALLARVD